MSVTLSRKHLLLGLTVGLAGIESAHVFAQKAVTSEERASIERLVQEFVTTWGGRAFRTGQLSNDDLIEFGCSKKAWDATAFRRPSWVKDNAGVPSSYVSSIVKQFFGKTVKHHSNRRWELRRGWYLWTGKDDLPRDTNHAAAPSGD